MRAGLDTPLGPVSITAENGAITSVDWRPGPTDPEDDLLREGLSQLREYFAAKRESFDLPLRHGREGMAGKLLDALCEIPFGETRTYGDLATELGAPAQAIGQACGANSMPLLIPCHRVLAAHSLGGFSAPGGIEAKVWLLKHEGAAGLLI